MSPKLATTDDDYCAALNKKSTEGRLVHNGFTDQVMTNIDALKIFVPIQSVVRNPKREI